MDRNQLIGLLLIFIILMGYFTFFAPQVPTAPPQHGEALEEVVLQDTNATEDRQPVLSDSARRAYETALYGSFAAAATGEDRSVTLENADLRLTLDARGGQVREVLLKDYQTYGGEPLYLIGAERSTFGLRLPARNGTVDLGSLYFQTDAPETTVVTEGDTARVSYRLAMGPNRYVEQVYTLPAEGFEVGYAVNLVGLDNELSGETASVYWRDRIPHTEKDLTLSRNMTTVTWYTQESFEELQARSDDAEAEEITTPVRWVGFKHKFFTTAIIADAADGSAFSRATLKTSVDPADSNTVKVAEADLTVPLADLRAGAQYRFYFGPNQFDIMQGVTEGFSENVYLGWFLFKWVNRFLIIPVFHLLETFIGNYGIIIILLVVIIKALLFPLSYRSYVSMGKTRVLKPELDAIREQHPDDMQKQQQEQMKLYQQVGVNPISGCVPLVLQMPILLAMFYFFPNSIELRQEAFLWAEDLSTYDSIVNLPFTIPAYGAHVSLFTLLMTVSQLVYTYYNNQLTAGAAAQGPLKAMTYLMPVIFMFVLNSYPAGLSFYYFVSNLVTISQQRIIRGFVDDEKIRAKLEANKEKQKGRKKSKFQQRLEEAMKQAQEQQTNNQRAKKPKRTK